MQIELSTDRLRNELALIKSILEKKSQVANTQNVLLVTSAKPAATGVLRLTGTDLDHTLQCDTEAKIIAPGSLCINGKRLSDIAAVLPAGTTVTIQALDNHWAQITCEKSQYKVAGVPPGSFPEVTMLGKEAKTTPIAAERLRTFINRTIFAITTDESRYQLAGAQFSLNAHRDRMVTTDGHRLTRIEGNGMNRPELENELVALVSRKTLNELLKLTQGVSENVEFAADDNHLYFRVGRRQLAARTLTGQFPNWEMIIPKSFKYTAAVMVGTLAQALRRVELMTDDRTESASFHFAKGELTLHANTPEDGEAHEVVPIEQYEGEPMEIGINVTYILDVLGALSSSDVVEFQLNDANSQVGIRPLGETGVQYTTITMPCRL